MATPEAQPAQPAPVPEKPSNQVWVNLVILSLLVGVAIGLWFVWWYPSGDSAYPPGGPVDAHDQGPDYPVGKVAASRQRMLVVADAMLKYRDEYGDTVRWPMALEDLRHVGLISPEADLIGALSDQPLVYAPDMPAGMDPARWAVCSDVLVTRRRNRAGYGYIMSPETAVVMLADGTVRVLQGDEIEKVGGLAYNLNAPR